METLTETIERVALAAGFKRFILGSVRSANIDADKIQRDEFPVLVLLPFILSETRERSGLHTATFPMNCLALDWIDQDVDDIDYKILDKLAVVPMRAKARQFLYLLNNESVINKQTEGITNRDYVPTYARFNARLHGVSVTCTVPIVEKKSGCV